MARAEGSWPWGCGLEPNVVLKNLLIGDQYNIQPHKTNWNFQPIFIYNIVWLGNCFS
jgi:hypothetical protein